MADERLYQRVCADMVGRYRVLTYETIGFGDRRPDLRGGARRASGRRAAVRESRADTPSSSGWRSGSV